QARGLGIDLRSAGLAQRGLVVGAPAAPDVQRPVEVEHQHRVVHQLAADLVAGQALRQLGHGVLRAGADAGLARRLGQAGLGAGLAQARIGGDQRGAAIQGFGDQCVQLRIAERTPPVLGREPGLAQRGAGKAAGDGMAVRIADLRRRLESAGAGAAGQGEREEQRADGRMAAANKGGGGHRQDSGRERLSRTWPSRWMNCARWASSRPSRATSRTRSPHWAMSRAICRPAPLSRMLSAWRWAGSATGTIRPRPSGLSSRRVMAPGLSSAMRARSVTLATPSASFLMARNWLKLRSWPTLTSSCSQ